MSLHLKIQTTLQEVIAVLLLLVVLLHSLNIPLLLQWKMTLPRVVQRLLLLLLLLLLHNTAPLSSPRTDYMNDA